ncbi:probable glutathione S-transferase GSTU1 [Miscanthus floridulus]|uniref:probable glutathione S-transferase GSTU1 n=1 Tax=Miscanthus floridulus TaxID=154761 RepID=UPI003457D3DF
MAGEKTGLQLLDFWVSPFAQRCRIALAEKGLAYESLPQDLANKGELLLRVNPVHKKIPVLLHDGRPPVCESLIILHYLDEAFPGTPPLLPADPVARAHARFWADYAEKKVFDCGTTLWKRTGQAQAQARPEMVEALRTLDAELGDKAYLAGEAFGFVDIAVVPFATWILGYGRLAEFSVEEVCPRLLAWAKRCGERESVAKNLYPPEKVYEFIGYLKDTYGDK